jgi:hypothetical protein
MFAQTNSVEHYKITNFLEFFCYLMDSAAYEKYYVHLDPENPWMWGVDLIVHLKAGLRVALANKMSMTHHYKGEAYSSQNPYGDMVKYLAKYGYSIPDIEKINPVIYQVFGRALDV